MELTPRQEQVLALLAEGRTNRQIGAALGISPSAVINTVYAIYGRIGVDNRVSAARWWLEHRGAAA